MSKLPGKLGPHVHPDIRVDATTLVLETPIKKMDRVKEYTEWIDSLSSEAIYKSLIDANAAADLADI